jgi:uncharacterized protein YueI
MCYYNVEQFTIFMHINFGIRVDEGLVGEESVLLYKEELDEELVSEDFLRITSEIVLVHTYVYETKDHEWMVCVVSDANTNHPLYLVCLKDEKVVYKQLLKLK